MTDEPRDLDEHLADVIRLPYANDDAIPSPVDQKRKGHECRHNFTVLVDDSHKLLCDDRKCQRCGMRLGKERCKCDPSWPRLPGCGIELDPWAWIQRVTADWRRFRFRYKEALKQAEAAEARLEELARRERNAKARIRAKGANLSTADARRARDQLRALSRALPNVIREVAGDDQKAIADAVRRAELCGWREADARRALEALNRELDQPRPEPS